MDSSPASKVSSQPTIAEPKKPRKDKTHWLYISVIVAVISGVLFGLFMPEWGAKTAVLGTLFVALIKMMIAPVIFCTIVLGIGSVRSAASVGRAGALSLIYFITMSTIALIIGLVVGNLIEPGSDLRITSSDADQEILNKLTGGGEHGTGLIGFVHQIIPTTLFSSLTSAFIMQTLFVALLCGFAIQSMGKDGEPLLRGIALIQRMVFKVLMMILWLAPIAAFGAIAGIVSSSGIGAVGSLLMLMLAFYITCVLFIFGVLGSVLAVVARTNIFKLCKYLGREFLLIVATSSSESALPNLMRKMEHAGVDKSTVGIVVPTGYSFNLDGTAIYLTMAAIFISDAMHKPMSLGEQIGLLLFMIIASKGAAGVSGAGIATLAAGLQAQHPDLLAGVPVIMGIDRFMSEARALTNFSGNAVATIVIGTWTKTVDHERVTQVLNGEIPFVETEDDPHVDLRNPSVENPADRLQPTPQVDLSAYQQHDTK